MTALAKSLTYPQHLVLVLIKNMRHEASVCAEPLTRHGIGHALLLLRHISNVIALRVHDDILIRLLESTTRIGQDCSIREYRIKSTYIMMFIISNCRCTTSAELASSFVAG